ncbi:MAG: BrnT family toxin [Acidovorax sp.]|uniref:BrnT family toxin n=1 Tax=Acidovorax sp. TaxID=1872122 RepID=UPI0039E2A827
MRIEFDEAKRAITLQERGLDFADAGAVFTEASITFPDQRHDYGEARFNTVGMLQGRMVVVTWTPRGAARRIISMRKANEREQTRFQTLG